MVTTYGAGPFVAGASLAAFEAIGCVHIPVGVGNTERLLTAHRAARAGGAWRARRRTRCTSPRSRRRSACRSACVERIIVGGEPGGGEEGFRRKLEEAWDAKVFEIMGIGDIAASLWGECPAQAGMHFSPKNGSTSS